MAFDPEKDKILKKWKCDETGLIISINKYADGEPKLQIGPRIYKKRTVKNLIAGQVVLQ